MYPLRLLELQEREEEVDRKRSKREGANIILTISERRQWLHSLRMSAGQDEALMDYKIIDPLLSLEWSLLPYGKE